VLTFRVATLYDLERVHRIEVEDPNGESLLTLPDDADLFEREIARLAGEGRKVALVVIDPIGAFLSGAVDSHKDKDVRRALAPMARPSGAARHRHHRRRPFDEG
jgi:hypothetical protein